MSTTFQNTNSNKMVAVGNLRSRYSMVACGMMVLSLLFSCKKMVEVNAPPTSVSEENVYKSNSTAIAVLTGIYTNMATGSIEDENLRTMLTSLSADELMIDPGSTDERLSSYYRNNLTVQNGAGTNFWVKFYQTIFITNSAIEQLPLSTTMDEPVRKQLMGEALFMRAFCYYYLVNYYGDVPLVVGTNFATNAKLARAPKAEVRQKMIEDLKEANTLLSENFLDASLMHSTEERLRPTKWAAASLLSRVYLDAGEYSLAEAESTEVINHTALFNLVPLGEVFLKNSQEGIWELMSLNATYGATPDGSLFILPDTGPEPWFRKYYLSQSQLNAFEPGDQRKTEWVGNASGYYYPYKYKLAQVPSPATEYAIVFRLAEQYLNRAEARAQQNNLDGAADDLNALRERAGLADIVPTTQEAMMDAVLHERQVELFTEGHRWLDLKRFQKIDEVMTAAAVAKGSQWRSYQQYFPIPLNDIQRDPFITQNSGY